MSAELHLGDPDYVLERLVELEGTIHPSLNVYRWWRSDMQLPAVYNWLTPADTDAQDVPACRIRDTMRITASVAIDPTAIAGEGDMLELMAYLKLALPILNGETYGGAGFGRFPFGQRDARRRGFQTVSDTLGDAAILVLELPLEVYLDQPQTPDL